jgi:hypothetical protein
MTEKPERKKKLYTIKMIDILIFQNPVNVKVNLKIYYAM